MGRLKTFYSDMEDEAVAIGYVATLVG
ncbi:hypothetical protein DSUL_100217 [Desulfovibrionales bacterium]